MILICEPQCEGYEHVEFNAALLAAARQAFEDPVLFMAEPGHLGLVSQRAFAARVDGISFRPIRVPSRHRRGARRLLAEARVHHHALRVAHARQARLALFTSTSSAGLFALKLLAGPRAPSCAVIPHEILESLGSAERWFPQVLRMRDPSRLRYLFLSPGVEREVLALAPRLDSASIEHPYLFANPAPHLPAGPVVRFGSIGTGLKAKGLSDLAALARDVLEARQGKAAFIHIGPVRDPDVAEAARDVIAFPDSRGFIPRQEFERELGTLDYAVFLSPSSCYRFSVSSAFLDAVSLCKPVIALRNAFFEHCFEVMGDIGYLCDSLAQVHQTVREICLRFPRSHYLAQQEQIRKGRQAFAPPAVGRSLREAFQRWGLHEGA
jgi:hypothetical protein